jgi:serine/alanine adding enzyme
MKVVNYLDETKWREFIDNHHQSTIFHTPEMFEVYRQTKHHEPKLWAVIDDDEYILALFLPVNIKLFNNFQILTTRAIAFAEILIKPGLNNNEILNLLLNTYNSHTKSEVVFTEIRNIFDCSQVQTNLNYHNFEYEEYLNYLIDLRKPSEDILQTFSRRTRKHIRQEIRKQHITIKEINNDEDLSVCYALIKMTFQNAKVPLSDKSLIEAAFKILYPKNMVLFTMAYIDKKPVCTSIELLYKDIVYGWFGGVNREYSSFNPNEYLMWYVLEYGAKNKFCIYDFGGAGKPDEKYGVRDFKSKFGGELVSYGRNTNIHKPQVLKISKMGYSLYRKFIK